MKDDVAISVKDLTKEFILPHKKSNSIKQVFVNLGRKSKVDKRKVLNDISFDVKKGEFFGIVGRNGCGKSTLLKILAGVYNPTQGAVSVNGSLTPFIELGVGFNPELTGRENVFLNGALLGFTHKQMNVMYKDIVEFAELAEFMDQKLKNYSSGMQVRLAFSIAIRAKSDILLIDEVLAVGDVAFQQKCYDYFLDIRAEGRTVIFVTHDMGAIRRFCNKALLVNNGKIQFIGEPYEVSTEYEALNRENEEQQEPDSEKIFKLTIAGNKNKKIKTFMPDEKLILKFSWDKKIKVKNVGFGIILDGQFIFGANTLGTGVDKSRTEVEVVIDLNLSPGRYKIIGGVYGESEREFIDYTNDGPVFIILEDYTKSKKRYWNGITKLDYSWDLAE